MAAVKNAIRNRLDADKLALGIILRQARTVDIAPAMQASGFDWLFLDLEHNSMDLDMAVQSSVAGGLPHLGYAKASLAETCQAINAATFVIVMLETPTAIANAEAIAAVPGIDSLLIGTNDLAMELGIPGAFGDERIIAAYQTVVDACRKHGKHAGVGGIADRELLRRYIQMGVRLVLPGSDMSLLTAAASETAATMRSFL